MFRFATFVALLALWLTSCSGPTLNEYIEQEPTKVPGQPTERSGGDADAATTNGASSASNATNESVESIPPTSTPVDTPTAGRALPTQPQRPTANPAPLEAAVAKINISSLALRRFPLDDAPTVGAVREGQEYSVSALSRDGKWVRLETPIEVGGRGWVAARFVSVFGEITGILITDGLELGYNNVALDDDQAVANTGQRRLRIRSGPGSSFETVFFAFNGELFTVLEESEEGEWVHLSNPSMDVNGWASRQFLRLASDPIPTARPSPTSTPTVLFSPPTARPTIIQPAASNLTTSTPTPVAPTLVITSTNAVTTNAVDAGTQITIITDGSRLRVRSEPTTDSEIVGRVLNGESYTVIETTEDGMWTKIALDEESGGWVSTRFTRSAEAVAP